MDVVEEQFAIDPDEYVAFSAATSRGRLLEALRFDLLGPESPEEVLRQSPATRYLVGMLAPQGTPPDPAEDEATEAGSDADDPGDAASPASMSLTPSSIGLSFVVDRSIDSLVATVSWGEYEKGELDEEIETDQATDIEREEDPGATRPKKKRKQHAWRRTQHSVEVPIARLAPGRSTPVVVGEDVQVGWSVRELDPNAVVSVFLVNARRSPAGRRPPDEMWLYQPSIIVHGDGPIFKARSAGRTTIDPDPDVASADVIYRNRVEFATGHGVAASWQVAPDGPDLALEVRTEVIPTREVSLVRPLVTSIGAELDMNVLATLSDGTALATAASPLLDAYEAWIDERAAEISSIASPDDAVAAGHVRLCRRSLARMRAGLRLLEEDQVALEAFRFANRAMAMQRRRSVEVLHRRRGQEPPDHIETVWRPFQLGFILQCLEGLVSPSHADRTVADLLWFPTGGGKTEAYLALTAFSLGYRRLRRDDVSDTSAGTSVLMRYTLRLLTIQQFQRATALLCACEVIRREDAAIWGESRFTVGLWVGESVTPNRYEDAKESLDKLLRDENVYEGNPYQLLFCPWCGTDLAPSDYTADDADERVRVTCSNRDCFFYSAAFREGLPVLLVDEEIYRDPPSLLLATVDKFAQMAWNGRIRALFGRVEKFCPRHGYLTSGEAHAASHPETRSSPRAVVRDVERPLAPPDLIIQDELHLISGPLGTLVGIYETAVDGLCTRVVDGKPVGPKVVASTATIRGAHDQIEALFWRKTDVFPPLGLDVADSFFAQEDPDSPGRLYVGVFAPGKSIKTALVRTYAALLARAPLEFETARRSKDSTAIAEADSYMTLVGYFNSLRELGGALRLVDDDVPARMRVLRRRGLAPWRPLFEKEELTSRRQSSQISDILKKMDRTFVEPEPGRYPIDVLLASNMISVGVDIDRLGLMVVSAQPKTSAEYIQATSRIGRVHPGLVIEVYNWVRPRDTSHYERFIHYHDTFYRHVEATSVTPFSARARDRALPAVLVSYVRQNDPALAQEKDAGNFNPLSPDVERIVQEIANRAQLVSGRSEVGDETKQMLMNRVAEWEELRSGEMPLRYSVRGLKNSDEWSVLLRPMELEGGRGHWPAAGSLREVEPEVDVILLEDGGDE